ncbi:MAG: aspartate kinase [Candidatus Goldbacteria bacterium]|nr:aspartate kinase [Candidatus Goldiibacteriota bacterium]
MALIVQKYGGASLATPEKFLYVADRIIKEKKKGNKMVIVVSAPGDTTDNLIEFAKKITKNPADRELDMLMATGEQQSIALMSMALISKGYKAISFTGAQVGIITDKKYTSARILKIKGVNKIKKALAKDYIAVVAGFQGVTEDEDITTLGRGGSDLTAVALAKTLNADVCEFLKDVEGVMTTNPEIVKDARKIDYLSYDEMLEMASGGAQVLYNRCVEFAKNYNIVLHVRGTFTDKPGTIIKKEDRKMEKVVVSGITYNKNEAKITILNVPDRPGIAAFIFTKIAEADINVDMIVQNISQKGTTDISFTILKKDLEKIEKVLSVIVKKIKAKGYLMDDKIGKVSVVGVGMRTHTGIASKMFKALAAKKINIEMISTSEIKISVVVRMDKVNTAVKVLHDAFNLGKRNIKSEKI